MCQGDIQWDNVSILASENQFFRRIVRESLEIQRQRTLPGEGLNKDIGRYVKKKRMASFDEGDNMM